MKQSILRTVCAFVLMAIALGVAIGILAGAKPSEPVYVWQSVTFASAQDVQLYSEDGIHLQTLIADETRHMTSRLLPEGRYYAFSDEVCVEFMLYEDRSMIVEGGCGWTDGKILHLTDEPVGNVRVEFLSERSTFYTFTLTGGSFCRRQIVKTEEGESVCCEFFGVPYGTYLLFCEKTLVARLNVDTKTPTAVLALVR